MYEISKRFDFCYGHRVWSQRLNDELSLGSSCACRHYHGHNGSLTVFVKAPELHNHMVIDFKNLSFIKHMIDTYIDHKFIIDKNDPLFKRTIPITDDYFKSLSYMDVNIGERIEYLDNWVREPEMREYYDSFFIVDFVPTSENLAKYFHGFVKDILKREIGGEIEIRIEFSETPKTTATYSQ